MMRDTNSIMSLRMRKHFGNVRISSLLWNRLWMDIMFVLVHTVRVCVCVSIKQAKSLSNITGTSTGFKSDMMFDTSRGILVNVSTSLFERLQRDRRKVEVNVVAVEICGQRISLCFDLLFTPSRHDA